MRQRLKKIILLVIVIVLTVSGVQQIVKGGRERRHIMNVMINM